MSPQCLQSRRKFLDRSAASLYLRQSPLRGRASGKNPLVAHNISAMSSLCLALRTRTLSEIYILLKPSTYAAKARTDLGLNDAHQVRRGPVKPIQVLQNCAGFGEV